MIVAAQYSNTMTIEGIAVFLNNLSKGLSSAEDEYLQRYRLAPDKLVYLAEFLNDAVEMGTQLSAGLHGSLTLVKQSWNPDRAVILPKGMPQPVLPWSQLPDIHYKRSPRRDGPLPISTRAGLA